MKVLQINLFYKHGSTGKIVEEIHNGCIEYNIDSYVAYAIGNHNEKNTYKFSSRFSSKFYTYLSAFTGRQYTYSYYETYMLIRYINKIKPDVVNIHALNINTVNKYRILEYLKKNKIKTVITFHSEIFYTGGCSHTYDCSKWQTGCNNCPNLWESTHSLFFDNTKLFWNRYKSIYKNFDSDLSIICVSNWLKNRAVKSPFFIGNKIEVIYNGIDTEKIYVPRDRALKINGKINGKINNRKVILHVTPSYKSKIKGGGYVKQVIENLDKEKYYFIIIGYDSDENMPDNVLTIKSINDPIILSEYYSLADLTLLTSEVETFSMVTAESLSCGTPVVGFKCGGPEEIALKEYSIFVEYGNIISLIEAIERSIIIHDKSINSEKISELAKLVYDKKKMIKKYIENYNSL
jgi:putative colanic acid biosynthesis glycosyltransferase